MVPITVRTFKFNRFLILFWTLYGFMGTSTSNTFLLTFTVLSDMVNPDTCNIVLLGGGGGGPIAFTSNAHSSKVYSTKECYFHILFVLKLNNYFPCWLAIKL